jgi:hypothetical protein
VIEARNACWASDGVWFKAGLIVAGPGIITIYPPS